MDRTEEAGTKIEAVRRWLREAGFGGVVLSSQANFAWITAGGHSHVSTAQEAGVASVVITADRATVVTSNNETSRLHDEQLPQGSFELIDFPWHSPDEKNRIIDGLAGSGTLAGDLPAPGRADPGPELTELRRVLLAPEIERYRDLAQDAALAVEHACRSVEHRESELHIAARVAASCYENDIVPIVNLVAADQRIGRYRHPLPTANRVDSGFLVALTARRHGLHASLTRSVSFGEPDAGRSARHLAAARIDARLILASRAGATLSQVLAAGIEQYEAEGHGSEWNNHHQGGTTGYAGREVKAVPGSGYTLRSDQALAWNPSIPGAKSEDTILLTGEGVDVLTSTGHWPQIQVEVAGGSIRRPGLLTR